MLAQSFNPKSPKNEQTPGAIRAEPSQKMKFSSSRAEICTVPATVLA
jgi:hypothetical protein